MIEAKNVERLSKEIEEYEKRQGAAIANMVAKLVSFAVRKLEEYFKAPIDEVLSFLNENPDLLDYKLLDAAIDSVNNPAIKFAINALIRMGGTIIRKKEEWREEFLGEGGEIYILAAVKNYDPIIFEALQKNKNVLKFIKGYIAYKLGL